LKRISEELWKRNAFFGLAPQKRPEGHFSLAFRIRTLEEEVPKWRILVCKNVEKWQKYFQKGAHFWADGP
jgi:hypothetical protein